MILLNWPLTCFSPAFADIEMPKIAHHVFFTLKDRSDASVQNLLSECNKYLNGHDGLIDFSVGVREKDLDREVNGDFDVSLHMVFADRPSQDAYQICDPHQTFIAANKDSWQNVIVYDSSIQG